MNTLGLSASNQKILLDIFSRYHSIEKVLVYGSRAKGNYKARSELDLVICNSKINRKQLGSIVSEINESDFPYLVDIQLLENITNKELLEHIKRVGKKFYKKTSK